MPPNSKHATGTPTPPAATVPTRGPLDAPISGATLAQRSTGAVSAAEHIETWSGDPNFMASLARGIAVIRAFTQQKRRLTISQLSQRTGIPRAAVRRCLYTLAQLGYVNVNEGKDFSLSPRILSLGHAYLSSTPLSSAAQPLLDMVSDILHESSSIALLEGDEILYVARSSTNRRIMSVDLGIGTRLPAYCTSMGRVLLAYLATAEQDAYLDRVKLVRHTPRTITTSDKLRRELEAVRRAGFAIVDQELEIGLRSIAVPVRDQAGAVVAAMNIGTHASRVTLAEMEKSFLPQLAAAANELGTLLMA
ncbi:MAG: IclR family transcriptional regulator C-terminal domain-containing protein [Betaproteobacteria bacterium]